MQRFLVFVLFLSGSLLKAQNFTFGARSSSLSGASSTFSDVWSCQNNQAGIAFLKNAEAGVYYENRFLLKELSGASFVFATPVSKKSSFGFCYTSFGYSVFRQSKAGLSYAMKLSENFTAGLQLDYFTTGIQDPMNAYGKRSLVTGEAGFIAKLTSQVTVSGHLFNIVRARLAEYNNELLPVILKAGIQYKFSEKLLLVGEAEKQTYLGPNFKGGIEYVPAKDVYLRAGASSFPASMSFGTGVLYKGLKLDIASSWHPILGVSPQFSMSYVFSSKKKADSNP